jgi:hypothetical protein
MTAKGGLRYSAKVVSGLFKEILVLVVSIR